jgi:diaminopimelate decarboxylase
MGLYYRDGELHLGETDFYPLLPLAKARQAPFYAYDLDAMLSRVRALKAAAPKNLKIHYAMKANAADPILRLFQEEKVGVDVVSGGEIRKALMAGFHSRDILFSGVGKTRQEIHLAISSELGQINVESPQELERIAATAKELKKRARIAFRINPDVDPQTHPYITTGFRENKFGMDESFLPELRKLLKAHQDVLQLVGITMHIGSQIRELLPFTAAIRKTFAVYQSFIADGHKLETFDIGGGLGIPYQEEHLLPSKEISLLQEYGAMVSQELSPFPAQILCEPGRILVASSGVLVGEVQYVKETPHKNFLITDTGIHHLIRPALYQAYHRILPLLQNADRQTKNYDIVGPICESSDVLGKNRLLHEVRAGEFLAVADAGAYGFTMASQYNEHELPEQIFFSHGKQLK